MRARCGAETSRSSRRPSDVSSSRRWRRSRGTRALSDKSLVYQFAQHPAQALFRDVQDIQQLTDRHVRVATDKVDYAMMRPPKSVAGQNGIRLSDKVAIGEKQQFDPFPDLVLAGKKWLGPQFYVSHIDLSRNLAYRPSVLWNIKF